MHHRSIDRSPVHVHRRFRTVQCLTLHRSPQARFQQLIRFKLRVGHCNVSKSDDAALSTWVRKQRANKQVRDASGGVRGLAAEQVAALEAVGFQWVVGVGRRPAVKDEQWQANYERLVQYRNLHGSLPLSIPGEHALNRWMHNQRARRKLLQEQGPSKAKGMTWQRVQALEMVGFKWGRTDRGR